MQNINISTGELRLSINGDENRVISFNPKDALFAEKFYRLVANFQSKFKVYEERAASLDEMGEEEVVQERLDLLKETCLYARSEIDALFGEGTSQTAFGDALSMDAVLQLFDGLMPFIQTARTEKIQKFLPPESKKKARKRAK